MDLTVASVSEATRHLAEGKRGGWIAFPFIIVTLAGISLSGGWGINMITFLKDEFNIKDIAAAKISNYLNGAIAMIPIIGAIVADSYLGCFSVICFSSLISLLGILLLLLTTSIHQLRPHSCKKGSNLCKYPSPLQFSVLYTGMVLAFMGSSGARNTISPMGANQFDDSKNRGIFFNWYMFTSYVATIISTIGIVYVQENISWNWGFAICAVANVLGLVGFLCGSRFYRSVERKSSSPFKSLGRVVVAAIRKRKMTVSPESGDYYHDLREDGCKKAPSNFCRFLNCAALASRRDSMTTHCTVEQVEDLKSLIRLVPLWLSGLILSIPIAIQISFIIFQANKLNKHLLGSHIKIPAASMQIFTMISTCITISILDRIIFPLWEKYAHKPMTPLQRIGIGHFLTVLSMTVSAIFESQRLKKSKDLNSPAMMMSVFWLVPQLAIVGMGEAFHNAGQVTLYYQEFPESLKNTSNAAVAMSISGAFYSSNLVIDLVRKATGWLDDDGMRLDNVYWVCCGLGGVNMVYYLVCAGFYKYREC